MEIVIAVAALIIIGGLAAWRLGKKDDNSQNRPGSGSGSPPYTR